VVAKKKPTYEPIEDIVDFQVALIQAARALDVAADFATANRDALGMTSVADAWLRMAEHLHPGGPDDEEGIDLSSNGEEEGAYPLGFVSLARHNSWKEKQENNDTEA
jgi:hypothetical protein